MVVPIHGGDPGTVDMLTAARALQNSQTAATAAVEVPASMGTAGGFFAALRRRGGAPSEEGWHCMVVPIPVGDPRTADLLTAARALQKS
jgi:hypothetical protein